MTGRKTDKKAFTLIELLVMISMVGILSAMVFANYGKSNQGLALDRATQKLSQDLRRTEELALAGVAGGAGTNGYGIYFDKTSGNQTKYIIYGNNNANPYYEAGTDTVQETVNIESGIKICDIQDNSVSANNLSVSFIPPDPTTYVGSNYTGHEASILLCVAQDNTQTRTVDVNNTGRIATASPSGLLNGACGPDNAQNLNSQPTHLCSIGTPSALSGSGPWTWTCTGANGGGTVNCSTGSLPIGATCGSSNGQGFSSAPTTNLCSFGTPSSLSGSGPWTWNCTSPNGGTPASCFGQFDC